MSMSNKGTRYPVQQRGSLTSFKFLFFNFFNDKDAFSLMEE